MIYYLILAIIIFLKIKLKKDGVFLLWSGFDLFIASIILDLLKLTDWSEFIIRVGFILFLLGFLFSIKENKV